MSPFLIAFFIFLGVADAVAVGLATTIGVKAYKERKEQKEAKQKGEKVKALEDKYGKSTNLTESLKVSKKSPEGITKESIADHVEDKYDSKADVIRRVCYEEKSMNQVPDTHYIADPRRCVAFVYENKDGHVVLFLKLKEESADKIKASHEIKPSKFPSSKTNDWFSIIVDESFTKEEVFADVDMAFEDNFLSDEEAEELPDAVEEAIEKQVQEAQEETVVEEPTQEEQAEEPAQEEQTEDAPVEEQAEEPTQDEQTEDAPTEEQAEDTPAEEQAEEEPQPELTLKESLALNSTKVDGINKEFVASYLEARHGDAVIVNRRKNYMDNGLLQVADTHYVANPKVCFTYVYENHEGALVLLLKLGNEDAKEIGKNHPINKSRFPKCSANDWYSLPIDESYSKDDVKYALDLAFAHCGGTLPTKVEETPAEEPVQEPLTLKESLALSSTKVDGINKEFVASYLEVRHGDSVIVNRRKNYMDNGLLQVADTHYVANPKVCFTYVYENHEGALVLLLKLGNEDAKEIGKNHPINKSRFPKCSANDWYSLPIDESYSKDDVKYALDLAFAHCGGTLPTDDENNPEEEPIIEEALTLKEALAIKNDAVEGVNKEFIAQCLKDRYGDAVIINRRKNYMDNGLLQVADTHYVANPKVCFTYVYENHEGSVVILLKLGTNEAKEIAKGHKVNKSRFPKCPADDWYALALDDSYDKAEIIKALDLSIGYNGGNVPADAPVEETQPEQVAEPEPIVEEAFVQEESQNEPEPVIEEALTLKEALAIENVALEGINKESIAQYLKNKYHSGVIINHRNNYTENGLLQLADTHYVSDPKVCFVYVYENHEGAVVLLLKTGKKEAKEIAKGHKVNKSKFPKCPADDWYVLALDDSYSFDDIQKALDDSYIYNGGKIVEEPIAQEDEEVLVPAEEVKPVLTQEEIESMIEKALNGEGLSLKDALSINNKKIPGISKNDICEYLEEAYGDEVELNHRNNYVDNDTLQLADTHYTATKKICFVYVYENHEGSVTLLLKLGKEDAKALAYKHNNIQHSKFPKSPKKDWYVLPIDESYDVKSLQEALDISFQRAAK